MKDPSQILALYTERQKKLARVHSVGQAIRRVYNGDHPLVLPELERNERASVANLIHSGIEQHAQRIASTVPNIICPPIKPTQQARAQADDRRLALQAWWHENKIPMKLRRRARYLIGYGTTPVLIRPCKEGYPYWETRDPLTSYPAPTPNDEIVPSDCIFKFQRSRQYLLSTYENISLPDKARNAYQAKAPNRPDDMFDVLQFIDANEIVMVCAGLSDGASDTLPTLLGRLENQAGCPLVVNPGRVTMDRLQGQFDQLIGMYEAQGTLWALHLHAVKRAIFHEVWVESRQGEQANIITAADPYQGDVGVIEGGVLQEFKTDPGVQTLPALDRLERSERLDGNIPAEFGGESPTNVRTDRRGLSVMGAAVDFPIQEHQELLAWSLEEEDKIAIATAKAYWPNKPKTFIVPFGRGQVTYTPDVTFDTDMHRVSYAYAGTDSSGLVIEGGQRIGQGTLSHRGFMLIDPMVTDVDYEMQQITVEALRQSMLTGIQQQVASPESPYPPQLVGKMIQLISEKGMSLEEADAAAHKWMQQQQAAQAGAAPAAQQPGNTLPGQPGTPGAATPIPGLGAGPQDLASMLQSLRRPQTGKFGQAAAGVPG